MLFPYFLQAQRQNLKLSVSNFPVFTRLSHIRCSESLQNVIFLEVDYESRLVRLIKV